MLEERIATRVEALVGQTLSTEMTRLLKRNLLDAFGGICASLQDVPLLDKFKRYAAAFPDADGVGVWGIGSTAQLVHVGEGDTPFERTFWRGMLRDKSRGNDQSHQDVHLLPIHFQFLATALFR